MLLGSSIPGWCSSLQLKKLVEHCRGSGQGILGTEDLGTGGCLCGHAGALVGELSALVKLLEMLEVAFQRCGGPAVPSFRSHGCWGAYTGHGRSWGGGQKLRGSGYVGPLGLG